LRKGEQNLQFNAEGSRDFGHPINRRVGQASLDGTDVWLIGPDGLCQYRLRPPEALSGQPYLLAKGDAGGLTHPSHVRLGDIARRGHRRFPFRDHRRAECCNVEPNSR
jgi:hypothetical protein